MTQSRRRRFVVKDVPSARIPDSLTVAPGGAAIAFGLTEPSGDATRLVSRIWLVGDGGAEGARPATTAERKAGMPRFSPDGSRIAYLVEGKDGVMQAAVLERFAEPRPVTDFDRGARYFAWAPDGKSLLVLAPENLPKAKKRAIDEKDDARDVDADEPSSRLWLVDIRGRSPKAIGPAGRHVATASWSPDGKRIAFVAADSARLAVMWEGVDLCLIDVSTRRVKILRHMTSYMSAASAPAFSPDGRRIAFVDAVKKGALGPERVYAMDLSTDRVTAVDREADQVSNTPRWLDNDTVVLLQQEGANRVLRKAPANGRAGENVAGPAGYVYDFAFAEGGGEIHFTHTESASPADIYAVSADGGDARQVTHLNRRFEKVATVAHETVTWKSREGWTIEGLLYRPSGRAPHATVIIPHGGPYGASNNAFNAHAQFYAAGGYAVFQPNFRGSTGYGSRFYEAISGDWGDGPADDILRGVDALVRKGVADAKRLVIHGASYGGFITAWLIGHTNRFRAAVAHAPVINNVSMWGTTDIPCFMEWGLKAPARTRHAAFWKQSPAAYLHKCNTPTLVVTGEKDARVPVGQSQELYQALRSAGVPTALVYYPREPHGIAEPRHQMDYLKRSLAWFREHLGKDAPR